MIICNGFTCACNVPTMAAPQIIRISQTFGMLYVLEHIFSCAAESKKTGVVQRGILPNVTDSDIKCQDSNDLRLAMKCTLVGHGAFTHYIQRVPPQATRTYEYYNGKYARESV